MKSISEWLSNQKSEEPQKGPQSGQKKEDRRRGNKPQRGNNRGRSRPQGKHANPPQRGGRQPQAKPAPQTLRPGKGLRVYPLGGFEQIGRNCFVIEVDGDIFIIDLGLQFPEEGMLGIDYLVPDISCLRGRENRIKGILFTHGHLDHIGAVQHLLPQLHFPPCYGTKLTMAMVKKRLDEEKLTSKCKLHNVNYRDMISLGKVKVEFIKVTHSIPDSAGIAVHTPYGTIVHTGDFKFDLTPMNEDPADFQRFAELGKQGVLAIIADSTNATRPGMSLSESDISGNLSDLVDGAKGRVIVSTFSSLLSRIQQCIDHAKRTNRKVFVSGRSMVNNIEIAQNLGYLKAPRGMIRKVGPGMSKLPDDQVMIITTGSQGEEMAGLARIGLGTHRQIELKKGDTVILSSNPVPGNERSVTKVINNLQLKGAIVHTNSELALHTTGHGHERDLLLMHRLVRAKHVIPEHGEPHMRTAHANIARRVGYDDSNVHLIVNGEILEFDHKGNCRKSKQKITVQDVMIDGYGSAGEGQRVLNDRKVMSKSGVVNVVFKVYAESKRLVGDPDVISRGLLYGSEQTEITRDIIAASKKAYEEALSRGTKDRKELKRAVMGALFRYFDRKVNREPMVIPIIIEV